VTPEFSRPIDIRQIGERQIELSASDGERAALARRFGLVAIARLEAQVTLRREAATVAASGRLQADITQSCAVSGEPLAVAVDEPIALRFVPAAAPGVPDEEIELAAEDCDEIEFDGAVIDLGEAVSQSLALAIDPYAVGPQAHAARAAHGLLGEAAVGPFAALAALKT
jgi:uncharacterized metal-binding protein YceD (DUF177 family)